MPTAPPTSATDHTSGPHRGAQGAVEASDDNGLREMLPAPWTAVPRAAWPLVVGLLIAYLAHAVLRPALGGFGVVLALAGINIILAVSLNIVNGYAGQFSI